MLLSLLQCAACGLSLSLVICAIVRFPAVFTFLEKGPNLERTLLSVFLDVWAFFIGGTFIGLLGIITALGTCHATAAWLGWPLGVRFILVNVLASYIPITAILLAYDQDSSASSFRFASTVVLLTVIATCTYGFMTELLRGVILDIIRFLFDIV